MCIIANGSLICSFLGLVPVLHPQMLGWSSNGSGVTGQVSTQLEILARKLGHQISY